MPSYKIPLLGLEEETLSKVLKKYKKNPCLWDPTHQHYHSKMNKSAAWNKLLKIWRKVNPDATQYDIKVKIFHMRTNYTRQRKKVESNAAVSTGYQPTLWYYKHLNFLSGQKGTDSDDDSGSDSDGNEETLYVHIPRGQKRTASESIDQETQPEPEPSTASVDESALAFGRSVGAQLHHLSKMQRCIAEKLISDVIYHGKLEELTTNATIKLKGGEGKDQDVVIPETEPSWYETATDKGSDPQSPPRCTFIVNEAPIKNEMDETENAVNFIKSELYESENNLDDQSNAINVVRMENLLGL